VSFISTLIDIVLHLDKHLNDWGARLGDGLYVLLFAIIFAETGLVVTPFLPGDSLLFAIGALSVKPGSPISLLPMGALLSMAAILGDAVNYSIGRRLGPAVFKRDDSRFLNKRHLVRAQAFYEKHGGKTIVFARFIPIIRTFAPFVAGVGQMSYPRFALYNVTGGLLWVWSLLIAGYQFADLPIVKERFHVVIFAIIGISLLPVGIEYLRARRQPAPQMPD
jgi:membrane-associated protein